MKRYLYLYWAFFRASLASDLEYRFNFALRIFTDISWYLAQILMFEILFRHSQRLGDWHLEQVRVFLGVLFTIDAVIMILFSENLEKFTEKVRKGDIDLLLAKPVSSQFILSCQKVGTAYVGNLTLAVSWLAWALLRLPQALGVINVLLFVLVIPCAVLIYYSVRFLFAALNIFLGRAENLNYLFYQFYRFATRPDVIFPRWIRYMILTVLPYAFVASVPTKILLGMNSLFWVGCIFLAAMVFVVLSIKFWKFSLAYYSSASS